MSESKGPKVWLSKSEYAMKAAKEGKRGYYINSDGTRAFKKGSKKRKSYKGRKSGGGGKLGVYKPTGLVLRGSGGYWTDLANKYIPKGSFAKAGESIGSTFGGGSGPFGSIGKWAGGKLADMVGFGPYDLNSNSLVMDAGASQVPQFGNSENVTTVRHREYIGDIVEPANNGGAFTLQNYKINAGLSASFPWLAQTAANYEQYKFLGLVYEFKSTSSSINNTAGGGIGIGTIVMATDYDSVDANFPNKSIMEQTQGVTSTTPGSNCMHAIECSPAWTTINVQYVRTAAVPANQDARMYDLGNFQIATKG